MDTTLGDRRGGAGANAAWPMRFEQLTLRQKASPRHSAKEQCGSRASETAIAECEFHTECDESISGEALKV